MGQTTAVPALYPTTRSRTNTPVLVSAKTHRSYAFADNVRFLSMAAVVWMHCSHFETVVAVNPNPHLLWLALQPFKFGTIGFFLISGFLMAESMTRVAPLAYFKRRLRTVALPWLIWFALDCSLWVFRDAVSGRFQHVASLRILSMILERVADCFLLTSYWFVPNLLVSICVILFFRRFLFDIRFGCALLLLSMFYGVNIYAHWIVTGHTEAIFGFVFYLWLGAWSWRNYEILKEWLRKVPITALVIALVSFAGLGICETWLLEHLGSSDSLNTLRITNQAFSILAVLTIVKIPTLRIPPALNIRATTFGIYLLHPIIFGIFKYVTEPALSHLVGRPWGNGIVVFCMVWVAGFVLTYGVSLAISQILGSRPQYSWLVGQRAARTSNS